MPTEPELGELRETAFGVIKIGMNVPITYDAIFGPFIPRVSPPGHTKVTPKSVEWLEARKKFEEQYEALVKLGEEQGFLEHAECYECSGELQITTNAEDREWVYDEPE